MSTDEQKADVVATEEAFLRLCEVLGIAATSTAWMDAKELLAATAAASQEEVREARMQALASDGQAQEHQATITALQERIKELEGALRPFDEFAEFLESETEGVSDLDEVRVFFEESDFLLHRFRICDFRRARSTLKDSGNGSEAGE